MKLSRPAGWLVLALALGALCFVARPAAASDEDVAAPFTFQDGSGDGLHGNYDAQPAMPQSVASCADFETEGRTVALTLSSIEPKGPRGNPYACILHFTEEDAYVGIVVRVDGSDHYRAARKNAMLRVAEEGFDLCRIAIWDVYGRFSDDDETWPDDHLGQPNDCTPHVAPRDAGAEARAEDVRATLGRVAQVTGQQMGSMPSRSLTVLTVTDVTTALKLYRSFGMSASEAAQDVRSGRSFQTLSRVYGSVIVLNLTRPTSNQALELFLLHEYTHFAQSSIVGASKFVPAWFMEGQAILQEARNGFPENASILTRFAEKAQREGTAARLTGLQTGSDWDSMEASSRDGIDHAYSKGYAAVNFLAERHGFEATVQLLRDNRNGSIDKFNALVQSLAGMDMEALDGSVGTWVATGAMPAAGQLVVQAASATTQPVTTTGTTATAAVPATTTAQPLAAAGGTNARPNARYVAAGGNGRFIVTLFTDGDAASARGTLEVVRDIPCGSNRVVVGDRTYTYTLTIQPDGAFGAHLKLGNALLTLDGRISASGELRGTMRYSFTDTACDTGLLPFAGSIRP